MIIDGGNLMFLSGHVPFRPDGTVAGPGLEAQLEQVFSNLKATLDAAGSDFSNMVRLTLYIRDYRPEQLSIIRTIRDRFIDSTHPPASALIGVAALFHPEVFVEIDAIAISDVPTK